MAASLAVAVAALATAAPSRAATITATVRAKVVKPLVLTSIQDFDLGTIMLGTGTWSGAVVRLTQEGVFTCPANVTCSGANQVAMYNIAGSNQATIRISAPNVTLTNQSDPSKTLTLVTDAPATVTLPNSGNKGADFPVGGSITVGSTTADGVYSGTFAVTADYQ